MCLFLMICIFENLFKNPDSRYFLHSSISTIILSFTLGLWSIYSSLWNVVLDWGFILSPCNESAFQMQCLEQSIHSSLDCWFILIIY